MDQYHQDQDPQNIQVFHDIVDSIDNLEEKVYGWID